MGRGFHPTLPDGWVMIGEAARALGIRRIDLWRAIRRGDTHAYREFQIGKRIFYGFKKEDLGI